MKHYLTLLLTIIISSTLFSQNIPIDSIPVVLFDCGTGSLFDSGSNSGSYTDNENVVMTICSSTPGFGIFASMLQMNIADGDILNIYDGHNTLQPILPDMPLDVNTSYALNSQFQASSLNTSGCLTFEFISNGDGNVGDFQFSLFCAPLCQPFTTSITSSIPDTSITPTDVYLNVCFGDTLFVNAGNDYTDNDHFYHQEDATSTYQWYWSPNDTAAVLGSSQSHFYDQPGGYIAKLVSYDDHGCRSYQDYIFKVRVTQPPEFEVLTDSILCFGASDTLTALPLGTINGGVIVQGDTVFFMPPFYGGDSAFLPDGNGSSYTSDLFVSGFDNNAMIDPCGAIEVCVTMEHSYLGDLDIELVSPNGTHVSLKAFSQGGGGTYLGNPWDGATQPNGAGDGLTYCFSNDATTFLVNGATQAATNQAGNTIIPDTYQPFESLSNFIGDDINGNWQIEITDNLSIDDGYIFGWSLQIHPCMYPEMDSFVMMYNFGEWVPNADIIDTTSNANEIIVNPTSQGLQTYTYSTSDQFGCVYEKDYTLYVDSFIVTSSPNNAFFCLGGDTVTLNANTNNPPICDYSIDMYDSGAFPWNNDWDGNSVTIFVDGLNIGDFTIDGSDTAANHSLEPFTVEDGQVVQIQYNNTGFNQGQVSYSLLDPSGTSIFNDGPTPTGGVVFSFTSVCNTISYEWTPNLFISDTTDSEVYVWPTTTTQYTVEAVNHNGCRTTSLSEVSIAPQMFPVLSTDKTICYGETVNLTASGASTYVWTPNSTLTDPTQPMVTSNTLTDITYQVEFHANGCVKTDSVSVFVNALPNAIINNNISPEFCEGSSVNLEIPNLTGWSYSWSPSTSSTNELNNVSTAGSYTVTYNDGVCENSTTVNVSENKLPIFDFSNIDTVLCCNEDLEILFSDMVSNVNVQDVYLNGVITNSNTYTVVTDDDNFNNLIFVKIVSDKNCVSEAYLPVFRTKCANPSIQNPDTVFVNSTSIFNLNTENTGSSTNFTWTTTDGSSNSIVDPTIENPIFIGTVEGLYSANVSVENVYENTTGNKVCVEVAQTEYEVVEIIDPQYPDAFTPNGDDINNVFKPVVNEKFAVIKEFRIYDRWGNKIYDMSTAENKNGWDGNFNGVHQQPDLYIYFITVEQPGKTFVKEGSVTLIR